MPIGIQPVNVCPVCEDNHVAPSRTEAILDSWRETVDAQACSQYPYSFVSVDDATHLVQSLAARLGCEPPQVAVRLLEKRGTTFRVDGGIEDEIPPLGYWLRHWTVDRLGATSNALVGFAGAIPAQDTAHHLTTVREEYVVSGDDGVYGWSIEGDNLLPTASPGFPLKVYGENEMSVTGVPLIAFGDLTSDLELPIECIGDSPHCKSYTVRFPEPIPPGQAFRIDVRCLWKGAFPRDRDHCHLVLPWGHHAGGGLDRLCGRLVVDTPLAEVELLPVDPQQPEAPARQLPVSRTERGGWLVEWELTDPRCLYLLRFRRNFRQA